MEPRKRFVVVTPGLRSIQYFSCPDEAIACMRAAILQYNKRSFLYNLDTKYDCKMVEWWKKNLNL